MTEQWINTESQITDDRLWQVASNLLEQKPDLERFSPDKITIPDGLKFREKRGILNELAQDVMRLASTRGEN